MIQCANCGAVLPEGKLFCTNCGKSLHDAFPAAPPAGAARFPGAGGAVPTQQPPPEGEGAPVFRQAAQPAPGAAEAPAGAQQGAPGASPYRSYTPPVTPPPAFQTEADPARLAPVGIGAWIGVLVVLSIPVVNLICAIVWACCARRQSLKNFSRAVIICWLVVLILAVLTGILLGVAGVSLFELFPHIQYYR